MKSIKELQNIDKPREKLIQKGVKALKDYELMAVLLGSGIQGCDLIKQNKKITSAQDVYDKLKRVSK